MDLNNTQEKTGRVQEDTHTHAYKIERRETDYISEGEEARRQNRPQQNKKNIHLIFYCAPCPGSHSEGGV